MALSKLPGKSVTEMHWLISSQRVMKSNSLFSDFLLMAICWEETFFNNIFQEEGGTGVGFGQVEPAEFGNFESETAMKNGYFVLGLPTRLITKNSLGKT